MDDLISRQAAIDIAMQYCPDDDGSCSKAGVDIREMLDELEALPSAQPERKNDDLILVKGSKGEWILVKGSNGKDYHKCSECLHTQEITGVKNYCAVCGAEMVGKQGMRIRLLIKGDAIQIGECDFYNPCKTIDVEISDNAIDTEHEHIIGVEIVGKQNE